MLINSTSSKTALYWIPDVCGDTNLYQRIPTISADSLMVGDIVPFGTFCKMVLDTWHNGRDRWYRLTLLSQSDSPSKAWDAPATGRRYEDVFRPIFGSALNDVEPVKKDSLWNGTCPRCGKGTYTGAFNVEHEDGSC